MLSYEFVEKLSIEPPKKYIFKYTAYRIMVHGFVEQKLTISLKNVTYYPWHIIVEVNF